LSVERPSGGFAAWAGPAQIWLRIQGYSYGAGRVEGTRCPALRITWAELRAEPVLALTPG